jgi:hypothetical protein
LLVVGAEQAERLEPIGQLVEEEVLLLGRLLAAFGHAKR